MKGLTKAFSCHIFAGGKHNRKHKAYGLQKIACTAIRRWNEKRHTDKTAGTRRTTLPETQNLNLRKVYRRHSRPLPHITSFIGTSSCKVLSAPSGSRRFICVLVEHPINTYTLWKPVQSVGIIIPKKHYSNTTRSASTC